MRVDLFDFELPTDRIALRPARPRDSARLLRVEGERISDHQVMDLPSLLRPGDVLLFNDTKVIPAQLEGVRGEANIGATLHKREGPRSWWSVVRNAHCTSATDDLDPAFPFRRGGARQDAISFCNFTARASRSFAERAGGSAAVLHASKRPAADCAARYNDVREA